jgi:hypothetical protein
MAGSFKTNPYDMHELLRNCERGILQLPDFKRSFVWDEDRITSLIASVSRRLYAIPRLLRPIASACRRPEPDGSACYLEIK